MPVKAAYLNAHIPSEQRATILSLDSCFANLGGVAGQTGWGWLAKRRSIAEAWVASGATLVLGVPLYWIARRADGRLDRVEATSPRTSAARGDGASGNRSEERRVGEEGRAPG